MTQSTEPLEQNFQFQIIKFLREMCDEEGMIGVEACKTLCSFNSIDNQTLKPIVENLILRRLMEEDTVTQFSYLKILNHLVQNSARISLFKEPQQQLQGLIS